jgi:hypothetical protein
VRENERPLELFFNKTLSAEEKELWYNVYIHLLPGEENSKAIEAMIVKNQEVGQELDFYITAYYNRPDLRAAQEALASSYLRAQLEGLDPEEEFAASVPLGDTPIVSQGIEDVNLKKQEKENNRAQRKRICD